MENKAAIDIRQVLLEIIQRIDEYYDYSFKIQNDKCFPIIIRLIDNLEDATQLLNTEQQLRQRAILMSILEAMNDNDYVRIRDILHYDLRVLIVEFSDYTL